MLVAAAGIGGAAHAQDAAAPNAVAERLASVEVELARQSLVIAGQQREIDALRAERDDVLAKVRAGRAPTRARDRKSHSCNRPPTSSPRRRPVAPPPRPLRARWGNGRSRRSGSSNSRPWPPRRRSLAC